MSLPGNRTRQFVCFLALCLLIGAAGCDFSRFWTHGVSEPQLVPVQAADLRPGEYCEIYMNVPPTSPEGSFHGCSGTVKEVNQDEVVLTHVLEASQVDSAGRARPFAPQKRDLVRVPLTGVKEIWALPPKKAASSGPAKDATAGPSSIKLPSSGAHPALPPNAAAPAAPAADGPQPLGESVRFDAQPAGEQIIR